MSPIVNIKNAEMRVDQEGHIWVRGPDGHVQRMLDDHLLADPITRDAALELEAAMAAPEYDDGKDPQADMRVMAASRRLMVDMEKLAKKERWLDEVRDAADALQEADQRLDDLTGLIAVLSIAEQARQDAEKSGRGRGRIPPSTEGER